MAQHQKTQIRNRKLLGFPEDLGAAGSALARTAPSSRSPHVRLSPHMYCATGASVPVPAKDKQTNAKAERARKKQKYQKRK